MIKFWKIKVGGAGMRCTERPSISSLYCAPYKLAACMANKGYHNIVHVNRNVFRLCLNSAVDRRRVESELESCF